MLARAPLSLRAQVVRARAVPSARFVHGHGEYHHLPFAWPGKKRVSFGIKLTAFLVTGFSIPFVAAKFQLNKSAT
ncbi:uncharacterized protein EDB93DRAFT_1254166 [Suillus bovinus]|uniref:uncharacterized protein n=1 Tax=Suillus bovinus TaxID=48563 RepID=UPI001B8780A0|nr:uncharacterized protein EDB93DRAFT_1254166 [Suillus bovinus]KAG2135921.1 hypothetical protein EDB93DRAFT_1254166 [Suillus bovinus]